MIHLASDSRPVSKPRTIVVRVRECASALGCGVAWARASGPHVLIGIGGDEAFARVTPLGGEAYGLAFRAAYGAAVGDWEPVLLIDGLSDVVEHALVAEGVLGEAAQSLGGL